MKKLNLLLLLLLPFLYACKDNCEGLECISESAFAFTIKSAESDEDLLFGNNATLTVDDVEVYYLVNGARQPAQVLKMHSYMEVYLEKGIHEYFVSVLEETDTIRVDFTEQPSSECCPSTTRIDQKTVNGNQVNQGEWVIVLSR
jgi:hypothetical protein